MSRDQITRAQVAALCLLAAAGAGPSRRLQRVTVWQSISLPVARALRDGGYVQNAVVNDVLLSPNGELVVEVARALRQIKRASRAAYVAGGARW